MNAIWSQSVLTGTANLWSYANVLVGSSDPFGLVFEAVSGSSGGLVALDEVSLSSGCYKGGWF